MKKLTLDISGIVKLDCGSRFTQLSKYVTNSIKSKLIYNSVFHPERPAPHIYIYSGS